MKTNAQKQQQQQAARAAAEAAAQAAALAAEAAAQAAALAAERAAQQRASDITCDISNSLKSIKKLLDAIDAKIDKILKIFKSRIDRRMMENFLKNPAQHNFKFMPGITLGDLLKEKLGKEAVPEIIKELGIDEHAFNRILEDKILPDKRVSEKLAYILKTKYEVKPDDFYICKAHTYTKIKILQDKSIDWESIEKKIQQKMKSKKNKK